MSPEEIAELTQAVAKSFGEDVAQETCAVFLDKRPQVEAPLRWWRRTARFLRNGERDRSNVRQAPRYWTESRWATTRPEATPEEWAACWELVERVPAEVVLQLVLMEGVRADHTLARLEQRVLRRHATKAAGWPQ